MVSFIRRRWVSLPGLSNQAREDDELEWDINGNTRIDTVWEEQVILAVRFNHADTDEQMIYFKVGDSEWEYSQGSEEFDFISNQIENIKWSS